MPRIIPAEDEGALAEARGELIPEDDYWSVRIEKVTEKQSKSKLNPGKPMYEVRFRIEDEGAAKGRLITKTICLWYDARFSIIQLNKSLGMDVTAVGDDGKEGFAYGDPWEYEGQVCAIRVKHENSEEYGKRAAIDRFLDQGKGGSTVIAANGGVKKPTGKVSLPRPTRGAPILGTPPAVDAVPADADVLLENAPVDV